MNKPELKKYRSNLRKWFKRASKEDIKAGMEWYDDAISYAVKLARTYDSTSDLSAGVIAVLSPFNDWEKNKYDAEQVFKAVKEGKSYKDIKVSTFDSNKKKAFALVRGEMNLSESSPKTYAFSRNIGLRDENYVTIDRWHLRACRTLSKTPKECSITCTPKQYDLIQAETVKVAKEFGIKPYQFQAIVWVTIKSYWEQIYNTNTITNR